MLWPVLLLVAIRFGRSRQLPVFLVWLGAGGVSRHDLCDLLATAAFSKSRWLKGVVVDESEGLPRRAMCVVACVWFATEALSSVDVARQSP